MAQLSLVGMLFFLSSLKKEIIMNQIFYDAIMENPVIAAVKDEDGVLNCIQKDINVVFVLFGELTTISDIVDRLKATGKIVIVHLDLIGGLAVREESVRFIKQYTKADGIISTKPDMIKYAKELGLYTIFRIFVIDSKAFNAISHHAISSADLIEILPGIMPRIIQKFSQKTHVPIIAGGLISEKEDVINALDAGAIAISSTNQQVWNM